MKYSYEEYLTLCQNLPTPERTYSIFKGWFIELEVETQITTMNQLDQNVGVLYP